MFELGGFIGALVAGWGSDKLFNGNRGPMNLISPPAFCSRSAVLWLMPFASLCDAGGLLLYHRFLYCVWPSDAGLGMAAAGVPTKKRRARQPGFVGLFAYLRGIASRLAAGADNGNPGTGAAFFVAIAIAAGILRCCCCRFLNAQAPRTASEA